MLKLALKKFIKAHAEKAQAINSCNSRCTVIKVHNKAITCQKFNLQVSIMVSSLDRTLANI